ncbi:MAG: KTSC domain-containing protein [Rhizobium sp.]|nr:KTSC domain-containing protein [Rhizobium sp.]
MQAVPVTSDLIEAVYFSAVDGRLRIRMRDGEERLFSGVSEGEVTALASAPSPGTYYIENIRTRYPRIAA